MAESQFGKHAPPWRIAFEIGSTLIMITLAVVIVWEGRAQLFGSPTTAPASRRAPIPTEPISIRDSATRGAESASVAIIEYADFECSFCARFAREIEPTLRREYVDTGRVLFVFKHFPLSIHKQASTAAQAAWCADRQGRFWEMHDRLFGVSSNLQDFDVRAAAKAIGLDIALYNSCRDTEKGLQQVQSDTAEGEKLKVSGTPVFFFGSVTSDRRVQVSDSLLGARSIDEFRVILDKLLGT